MSLLWAVDLVEGAFNGAENQIAFFHSEGVVGWEGWAQVEVAYFISAGLRNLFTIDNFAQLEILREEQVYEISSRAKCDFAITLQTDQGTTEQHIVELKCKSGKENANSFISRVESDVVKVREAELRDQGADHISVWAIALAFDDDDEVEGLMNDLGQREGVEWTVKAFTRAPVKIWAAWRVVNGDGRSSIAATAPNRLGIDSQTSSSPTTEEQLSSFYEPGD